MSIDEKKRFFIALLKGSARLVAILALLIVIITPIGMVYEYFDFYPQILNEFEYHDYPENYVKQQYLPDEVKEEQFYIPTENGYENHIKEHLKHLREDR